MGSRLLVTALFLTAACELPFAEPYAPEPAPDAAVFTPPDAAPDAAVPAAAAVGGVPSLPWLERSFVVVLNGARAAPLAFRDRYMDVGDATSPNVFDQNPPARPPLAWNEGIAEAARFHAEDHLDCFTTSTDPHGLCDGTGFWGWVTDWTPPPITAGVAHPWKRPTDRNLPLWFTSSFICDGLLRSDGKVFGCVSDTSTAAGHRKILVLTATETQIGAGFAATATFAFFSGETTREPVTSTSPMPTAGHFFSGDQIVFAANVEAQVAPRSVTLVMGGERRRLSVDLGTATRGMFAASETAGTACRAYHFELIDAAGKVWRLPAVGSYATWGEGGCTQDLVP